MNQMRNPQERGGSKGFDGLKVYHVVHTTLAVVAAALAVATPYWIQTSNGLLGVDHAGLWQVCYAELPTDAGLVENRTKHLVEKVEANLYQSGGEGQTLSDQQLERVERELKKLGIDVTGTEGTPTEGGAGEGAADPSAGVEPLPSSSAPNATDDAGANATDSEALTVNQVDPTPSEDAGVDAISITEVGLFLLVDKIVVDFPLSSGCTDPLEVYKDDGVGWFFSAVPYPNGPSSYALLQVIRAGAVGLLAFGALALFLGFILLAAAPGKCRTATLAIQICFSLLSVICGMVGIVAYCIALSRISTNDSKQVLNVSYLFVDEQIEYGLENYWGWSAWVFIAATCWSLLGFVLLAVMACVNASGMGSKSERGLLPQGNNGEVEFVPMEQVEGM